MSISAEAHRLRSMGEAHCYVAVVKADGVVSTRERFLATFHARRSQESGIDVMRSNRLLAESIAQDVWRILHSPEYRTWDAERHVEEALLLLSQAISAGIPGTEVTAQKIEAELRELAYADGYDLQESLFVRWLLERLSALGREVREN